MGKTAGMQSGEAKGAMTIERREDCLLQDLVGPIKGFVPC